MSDLKTIEQSLNNTLEDALSNVSQSTESSFPDLDRLKELGLDKEYREQRAAEDNRTLFSKTGSALWEFPQQTTLQFLKTASIGATDYLYETPEAETLPGKIGAGIGMGGGMIVGFGKVRTGMQVLSKGLGFTKVKNTLTAGRKIDAQYDKVAQRLEDGAEAIFRKHGIRATKESGLKNVAKKDLYRRVLHGDPTDLGPVGKVANWETAFKTVAGKNKFLDDMLQGASSKIEKFGLDRGVQIGERVFDEKSGKWVNSAADELASLFKKELGEIGGRPLTSLQDNIAFRLGDTKWGTFGSHLIEEAMLFAAYENIMQANAVLSGQEGAEWNQMGHVTQHAIMMGLVLGATRFIPGGVKGMSYLNKPGRDRIKALMFMSPTWASKYKTSGKNAESYTQKMYEKGFRLTKGSVDKDRSVLFEMYRPIANDTRFEVSSRIREGIKHHPLFKQSGLPRGASPSDMRIALETGTKKEKEAVAKIIQDGLNDVGTHIRGSWRKEWLDITKKDLWASSPRIAVGAVAMTGPGVLLNEDIPFEDKMISLITGAVFMKHGKTLTYKGQGSSGKTEWLQDGFLTGHSQGTDKVYEQFMEVEQMHNMLGGKVNNTMWQNYVSKINIERGLRDPGKDLPWGETITQKASEVQDLIFSGPKKNKHFIQKRGEKQKEVKSKVEFTDNESALYHNMKHMFDNMEVLKGREFGIKEEKYLSDAAKRNFRKTMDNLQIRSPEHIVDIAFEQRAPQILNIQNSYADALHNISMSFQREGGIFPARLQERTTDTGLVVKEVQSFDTRGLDLTAEMSKTFRDYDSFVKVSRYLFGDTKFQQSPEAPIKLRTLSEAKDVSAQIEVNLNRLIEMQGRNKNNWNWEGDGKQFASEMAYWQSRRQINTIGDFIKNAWLNRTQEGEQLGRLIEDNFVIKGQIFDVNSMKGYKNYQKPFINYLAKMLDLNTNNVLPDPRYQANIRKSASANKDVLERHQVNYKDIDKIMNLFVENGFYDIKTSKGVVGEWRNQNGNNLELISEMSLNISVENSRINALRDLKGNKFDRAEDFLFDQILVDHGVGRRDGNTIPRIFEDITSFHANMQQIKDLGFLTYIKQRQNGTFGEGLPRLGKEEYAQLKALKEAADKMNMDIPRDLMPVLDKWLKPRMLRTVTDSQGRQVELGYKKVDNTDNYIINKDTMLNLVGELMKLENGHTRLHQSRFLQKMAESLVKVKDTEILDRAELLMEQVAAKPSWGQTYIAMRQIGLMEKTSNELKWDAERIAKYPEQYKQILEEALEFQIYNTERVWADPTKNIFELEKRIELQDGRDFITDGKPSRTFDELNNKYGREVEDLYKYDPTNGLSKAQQFQDWFYMQKKYRPEKGKTEFQWDKLRLDVEKHILKQKPETDVDVLGVELLQTFNALPNNLRVTELNIDSKGGVSTERQAIMKSTPREEAVMEVYRDYKGDHTQFIIQNPNFKHYNVRQKIIEDLASGNLIKYDLTKGMDSSPFGDLTKLTKQPDLDMAINNSMLVDTFPNPSGFGRAMRMDYQKNGDSKLANYITQKWYKWLKDNYTEAQVKAEIAKINETSDILSLSPKGTKLKIDMNASSIKSHDTLLKMHWDLVYSKVYTQPTWNALRNAKDATLSKALPYFKQYNNRSGIYQKSERHEQIANYLNKSKATFEGSDFLINHNRRNEHKIPIQFNSQKLSKIFSDLANGRYNDIYIADVNVNWKTGEKIDIGGSDIAPPFSTMRQEIRNLKENTDAIEQIGIPEVQKKIVALKNKKKLTSADKRKLIELEKQETEMNEMLQVHKTEYQDMELSLEGGAIKSKYKDMSIMDGATESNIETFVARTILTGGDLKKVSGVKAVGHHKFKEGTMAEKQGITEVSRFFDEMVYGKIIPKGQPETIFTTEKGSTYVLDGPRTTRTKSKQGKGDSGLKAKSEVTMYLTPQQAREINTSMGIAKRLIGKDGKSQPFLMEPGPKPTQFQFGKKLYDVKRAPEEGLMPFEIMSNGAVHLGHKITKIETKEPTEVTYEAPKHKIANVRFLSQVKTIDGKYPKEILDKVIRAEVDVTKTNQNKINEAEWSLESIYKNFSEKNLVPHKVDSETLVFSKNLKSDVTLPPNKTANWSKDATKDFFKYVYPEKKISDAETKFIELTGDTNKLTTLFRNDISERFKNRSTNINELDSTIGYRESVLMSDVPRNPYYWGAEHVKKAVIEQTHGKELWEAPFQYGGDGVVQGNLPKARTNKAGEIELSRHLRDEISSESQGYYTYGEVQNPSGAIKNTKFDPEGVAFGKHQKWGKDKLVHISDMRESIASSKFKKENPELYKEYKELVEAVDSIKGEKYESDLVEKIENTKWNLMLQYSRNPEFAGAQQSLVMLKGYSDSNAMRIANGVLYRKLKGDLDIDNLLWINSMPKSVWNQWERQGKSVKDIEAGSVPLELSSAKDLKLEPDALNKYAELDWKSDIFKGTGMQAPRTMQDLMWYDTNKPFKLGELQKDGTKKAITRKNPETGELENVVMKGFGMKVDKNQYIFINQNKAVVNKAFELAVSSKVQPAVDAKKQYNMNTLNNVEQIRHDIFFGGKEVIFKKYDVSDNGVATPTDAQLQAHEIALTKLWIDNILAYQRVENQSYNSQGVKLKDHGVYDRAKEFTNTYMRGLEDMPYRAKEMMKEFWKNDYSKWERRMGEDTVFGDLILSRNPENMTGHKKYTGQRTDLERFTPSTRQAFETMIAMNKMDSRIMEHHKTDGDATIQFRDELKSMRNERWLKESKIYKEVQKKISKFSKQEELIRQAKEELNDLYTKIAQVNTSTQAGKKRRDFMNNQIDNLKSNLKFYESQLQKQFKAKKDWKEALKNLKKQHIEKIERDDAQAIKNKSGKYADKTDGQIKKMISKEADSLVQKEGNFPFKVVNNLDFVIAKAHYETSNMSKLMQANQAGLGEIGRIIPEIEIRINKWKKHYASEKELLLNDQRFGTKKSQYTTDKTSDPYNLLQADFTKRFMMIAKEYASETKQGIRTYSDDMIDLMLHMLKTPKQNDSWVMYRGHIMRGFETKNMQDFITIADKLNFQRGESNPVAAKAFEDITTINFNQSFESLTKGNMRNWSEHLGPEMKGVDAQNLSMYEFVPERLENLHSRRDFETWLDVTNQRLIHPDFGRLDTYEQLSTYFGYGGLDFGAGGTNFGRIHSSVNPRYADKPMEQGVHTMKELLEAEAEGSYGLRASGLVTNRQLKEAFNPDNSHKAYNVPKQKTFLEMQTEKANKKKKKLCLEGGIE